MAKKATSRKTARSSKVSKATRKPAKRAAKPAKAAKRTAKKRKPTKAAKSRNAARAAAGRSQKKPAPKSRLSSAATLARGIAATAVAAVAKRLPWAKDENDPIVLLETDHRRFEKLLEDGEATTERAVKGRGEVLKTLTREITVHEAIEEQILYPALRPHAETHHIVLEGIEEHHVADVLIKELHDVRKDDEKWGAKFKVLKESLTHHIGEEEKAMFPAARGALSREELLALGARMRALKAELEA